MAWQTRSLLLDLASSNDSAQNMCKLFSLIPSKKPCHQRKVRKTKCNFQFLNLQLYQKSHLGSWQLGKIVVLVNSITQKLKSKHLFCLCFLWWQVFLREREKIFYTYSGPLCDHWPPKKSTKGYANLTDLKG